MRKLIVLVVFTLFTLSAKAVKLNQRGEKMVSEIRVEYENEKRLPFTIKFGYEKNTGEIASLFYECNHDYANEFYEVKMQRLLDGNIKRDDFVNGKAFNRYTFLIDSQKRPIEMVWYEKNIHGKFVEVERFNYDYDFQDFDLSITNIEHGDDFAALRESIKMINNNAYVYNNVINLRNGKESIPKQRDRRASYSDKTDLLNVDISQILRGYCNVGNSVFDTLGSNFIFLLRWAPVRSIHLPSVSGDYYIEYEENDGNIEKVYVYSIYTKKLLYSINIKYVE